ncbi:MAG: BREX-6 system phosphatase PglZ [Polyangiaceae bacterium]|jgi:hypothetical protein|nr:BREX-6 system phosphatase PglZ [Polyangiaceae bacterium]
MPPSASALLTEELKKKVREHGIVVFLDPERHYTGLVSQLARPGSAFDYGVVSYQDSFLELMLSLERYGCGLEKDLLLLHLPGISKETVKSTPVLELYEAGTVHERALSTLVREAAVGAASPPEIDGFLRTPGLTLEVADAWLAGLDAAPRDELESLLETVGIEQVVIQLVATGGRHHAALVKEPERLLPFLAKHLGLTEAWRLARVGEGPLSPHGLARLVATWLMAVEFVHDLQEPPVHEDLRPLKGLGAFAKECKRLAALVRDELTDEYEEQSQALQAELIVERESHKARALGSIDTFLFEEGMMRAATIEAILGGEWAVAAGYAASRTTEQCFWVRRSEKLQRTWEILRLAAKLGRALSESPGLSRCASLDEAVERYTGKLAPLDRQHRLFEQEAHRRLFSDLEDHDRLLEVRRAVRLAYRAWADAHNRAFFELCVKHGALPQRDLQQRALFADVVQPLVERDGPVALFLVDALRFEMAQALGEELGRGRAEVSLRARLAELPTITAIGMNALPPVERDGRLRLVWQSGSPAGFHAGELAVTAPAARIRVMQQRVSGGAVHDLQLEAFDTLTLQQAKRLLVGKRLVVVRSRELDDAGESGMHLSAFDRTLGTLRAAIQLLTDAGVARVVVTSDHGFLLQDETTEAAPIGANRRVAQRRFALLSQPSGMSDVLEVKLSSLGYDSEEEGSLVFRPDTAHWRVSDGVSSFSHGGNSLQERVIPVLEIARRGTRGKSLSRYEVLARPEPVHLGRQRLKVAVRLRDHENMSLGFVAPKAISLALRVKDRPDVVLTLLRAGPPASLAADRVLVPPGGEEALIELELEGTADEHVRVEVFHPDGVEDVTAKVVEGFFEVQRDRRAPKAPSVPPPPPANAEWVDLIEDPQFRKVLELISQHHVVNEEELVRILGSARRVRSFASEIDVLATRVPFEIEVRPVDGMKVYKRRD